MRSPAASVVPPRRIRSKKGGGGSARCCAAQRIISDLRTLRLVPKLRLRTIWQGAIPSYERQDRQNTRFTLRMSSEFRASRQRVRKSYRGGGRPGLVEGFVNKSTTRYEGEVGKDEQSLGEFEDSSSTFSIRSWFALLSLPNSYRLPFTPRYIKLPTIFQYGAANQTIPHHSVHLEQLCRRSPSDDWRTHVRMRHFVDEWTALESFLSRPIQLPRLSFTRRNYRCDASWEFCRSPDQFLYCGQDRKEANDCEYLGFIGHVVNRELMV